MRVKRAKVYRKLMQFYQQTFEFREPYQILVSPDFILEAVSKNIDLSKALEEVVGGKVRVLITYCSICDIRKDSPQREKAIATSKGFEKRRCPHKTPIKGIDCMKEIMGDSNKHNYCVAVQDQEMRSKLRQIKGVPILHVSHSVVVLEPIPRHVRDAGKDRLGDKAGLTELERKMLKTVKEEARQARGSLRPKRKIKKAKGPNPLAVKKAKNAKSSSKSAPGTKRPRTEANANTKSKKPKK
ncbi:hypothetical protein LPJ78_005415 [Coemansia sp. RSA 989]|nr:Fcf1-domain-containing protein [Coemansia mojavensis]KAJ1861289.1 hypothetical protein LPJ78_005415 [Coemansia sp. RSA 989]KAJ1869359.1 hypothetical protein LPJ55_005413 [Coemansia sp. RSA 990]